MTLRFRRSFGSRGMRFTVGKRGVSASTGIPGFRYTLNSSGRRTRTVSVPGTGMADVSTSRGRPAAWWVFALAGVVAALTKRRRRSR
ncbi:MAG: DUF4236 domain-containing protein [Frankia sp.]|nr:DUF4236 domain-containing protein [Frankia sp.]